MRSRGLFHSIVRFGPRSAPVATDANASLVFCDSTMAPHLWPWKIVCPAIHTPNSPFHIGIEYHPVSRVRPLFWNTISRAHPRLAAIFATEESNICGRNELPLVVKRVEMVSVRIRDVEASARPAFLIDS